MDTASIIAIAVIGSVIAITVAIVYALDRLARSKVARRFRACKLFLDPGTASVLPGPEIKGSFRGRQFYGFRRTETVGFTSRGGENGKTLFQFSCSTPLQFTVFTFPTLPAMAELLQGGSSTVSSGDLVVDRTYGFASPDPVRFQAWMAQPENKKAVLSLMSMMPASRRQRFRVRVEGILELNMPEYLFFKMKPETVKALLQQLDSFAAQLELARV